jgi:hypothetical protein
MQSPEIQKWISTYPEGRGKRSVFSLVELFIVLATLVLAPMAANATRVSSYLCPQDKTPREAPLLTYPHFFINGDPAKASDVTDNFDWFQKCPYFTGKVGIGTNNPQQKLHIAGDAVYGNQTGVQIGDAVAGWAGPLFLVHNEPIVAGNTYYNTEWRYGGGTAKPALIDLMNGMHFYTSKDPVGRAGAPVTDLTASNYTAAERMTITPDGKVGIGTIAPQATLDVNGTIMGASRSPTGVAQRICSGQTTPGATNWQNYNGEDGMNIHGIYVDIDTSGCGFTQTPIYIANLAGDGINWDTTGGSSPYFRTPTGFRIYVRDIMCATSPNYAVLRVNSICGQAYTPNGFNWHINWMAIGK